MWYTLSEAATVTFKIKLRSGRVFRSSFKHKGRKGRNRLIFTGRLRGRKLRPGRYSLVATARNAGGHISKGKAAKFFTVTRR